MGTKAETIARLHDMKEQEPFRNFSVVTTDGSVLPVKGRYLFAFNRFMVLVGDKRGRTNRVRLENVARIDQQKK